MSYAYYDPEADIAYLSTGKSGSVVSEEVEWGLIDHDEDTDVVVGLEIWAASKRLPKPVLDVLPSPGGPLQRVPSPLRVSAPLKSTE